ncbi:MAG TPA: LemA family protein [Opitutaceae bacterium]|nr:LemA family protein [Opitutaceae bacterium]
MPWYFWVSPVAALLLLWGSLMLRRKQRLLADMPTSKAAGVFIGMSELKGTAESEAHCTSHLAELPCVHYSYTIEERWSRLATETYTDTTGRPQTRTRRETGWDIVDARGESPDFYVKDDTGAVLVKPEGAKIEPLELFSQTVSRGDPLYHSKGPYAGIPNSDHVRRFVEYGIPLHTPLYIVGRAREREDLVAAEIAADKEADLFLISTRTEEKIQSGYAVWSWICLVLGLVALVAGMVIIDNPRNTPFDPLRYAGVVGCYVAVFAVGWVWMVYNSLVSLRERTRQGWSLVDVQLKRRHDLIPGIAAACAGLATHEREVQAVLASLRTQQQATAPGKPGADFAGVAGELRVVIERYPSLMANDGFAKLHAALVETEQRVALARAYYNEIATALATRLEIVPDRFVGALAGIEPPTLLHAENFERASLAVRFE